MKLKKLIAGVASMALAATALTSVMTASADNTLTGVIAEENGYEVATFDLLEVYPELSDASLWVAGISMDVAYEIDGLVEVVEGFGIGCGGNVGIYAQVGADSTWIDKNSWAKDVNWNEGAPTTCSGPAAGKISATDEIVGAGIKLYNFQQQNDGDLDSVVDGKTITVTITNESWKTDAPVDTDTTTDAPVDTDTTTDAPVDTDTTTDAPVVVDGPRMTATVEDGKVVVATADFADLGEVYGLQYAVEFSGATYTGVEKAELPEGWSVSTTKTENVTDTVKAIYDCDFSAAMGDQTVATFTFSDIADDASFKVTGIIAVVSEDGSYKSIALDDVVATAAAVDTDTETPDTDTNTDTTTDTTTDTAADTTTDTNAPAATDTDKGTTTVPNTGVAGIATVAGLAVVTLAGTVISKKRG